MIKKLIVYAFLLIPVIGFSNLRKSASSFWIIKDSVSKNINGDSANVVFHVFDHPDLLMLWQHPAIIQVKVDGKPQRFTITHQKRTFKLMLPKGKHRFTLFVNANFQEVAFNVALQGGHYYKVGLNFEEKIPDDSPQIMLEKPVVYLYSETKQAFSLKINTVADIQFSYPAYEKEWKGTSSPDGTVRVNGSDYPYLFWDAQLPVESLNLDWHHSDQILGKQTIPYLSSQLDHLGFNPKEKSDFITYWGPRMQQMNYVQVLWLQDEAINGIASLDISPEYTQNRIYIVFKEINDLTDETLELKLKTLKPINRSKNCLLEWGGMELKTNL